MLELYDYPDSGNGYKVRLLLTQLGQPFQLHPVDILKGESRTAEFLQRNPNGRIPVLRLPDGTYLSESNAILFYLAEGSAYLPDDRLGRAQVLQWLCFEQYSHEPNIATRRFMLRHLDPESLSDEVLEQKLKLGCQALDVMEQHLSGAEFFVGGRYSIADIGLFAYTHVADEGGFDLTRYAQIQSWCDRVRAQPGFRPLHAEW